MVKRGLISVFIMCLLLTAPLLANPTPPGEKLRLTWQRTNSFQKLLVLGNFIMDPLTVSKLLLAIQDNMQEVTLLNDFFIPLPTQDLLYDDIQKIYPVLDEPDDLITEFCEFDD